MKIISSFFQIVDKQTIIISILSMISTYLCLYFGVHASIPAGLIGIAVIFPIVFSINAAYRRREDALKSFASFRGHAISIFYAHRDWHSDTGEHVKRIKNITESLLDSTREYFISPEENTAILDKIYQQFSLISESHEKLRASGVPTGEISRLNQYLKSIVIDFEKMRNIYTYRTPISLRAYSQVFLNIFPIIFGPYFAHLALEAFPAVGYGVALLYSVVLVSLDNIQEDLENPYDGIGEDDIDFDVTDEFMRVIEQIRQTPLENN